MDQSNNPDFEVLRTQRAVRLELAAQSHFYFFHLYMPQYVQFPTADFHREMFTLTENESVTHAVIVACRTFGKSTIMTLSYPMWAILGKQRKRFVVLLSQTQVQARSILINIKHEFEGNPLLRKDYGPLEEESDIWGQTALYLPKFDARIIAASAEQSIRGLRHGAHRPDLIICDDVEDLNSVRTKEGRDKTYNWLTGEVIPLGDKGTKMITVGNLLHEDSALMRLKAAFEADTMSGVYKSYPLVDGNGQCLWPGKYPDEQDLIDQEQLIGNPKAYLREYLLKIVPEEDQIIDPAWFKYYAEAELPKMTPESEYLGTFIAVDVAMSEKQSADYTAVVVIHVFGLDQKDRRYYIDKRFINQRLTLYPACGQISQLFFGFSSRSQQVKVLVEQAGIQGAVAETLVRMRVKAEPVPIQGDKHARLTLSSMLFESGKVFFPEDGSCDQIAQQLIGFGVEIHDDLVDAVTLGLNYIAAQYKRVARIHDGKKLIWGIDNK